MTTTPTVPLLERQAAADHHSARTQVQDPDSLQGAATLARLIQAKHPNAFSTTAYISMLALQRAMDALTQDYLVSQPQRLQDCVATSALSTTELQAGLSDLNQGWSKGDRTLQEVELLQLQILSENPALQPVNAVLGTQPLLQNNAISGLSRILRKEEAEIAPGIGFSKTLGAMLAEPSNTHADSLEDQLRYILDNWTNWLDAETSRFVVGTLDLLAEENQFRGVGPGPAQLPGLDFNAGLGNTHSDNDPNHSGFHSHQLKSGDPGFVDDSDRFSLDKDWMPNLILIAKQSYVWLNQLSQRYQRDIHRLDQIPDEELDQLAERGFSGLWLIGLWERSKASQNIKKRRGNPEAESSAYSLKAYAISERLGGQSALENLKSRAEQRGIRLAADMVPNHMGMDSEWMVHNPDWFLQLPEAPYPGYRFDGPDVSGDERIQIRLEDGYWNETDAAVVFQCTHRDSGQIRYVYHGNDGTQMPWNDTAQLDYLQPAVREAVIQVILDVAREFRVIRFDAAMTLARKHIQRLWYPPPGDGGAIPSRSEHSVDPEFFNEQVPGEFWREVVDRIAKEVPDTLLLAEAFWMMEGYFVRTLGMHRVYNSAFMHMLRDEDNAKYRQGIRDVLAYSPAILERYVNFMNNPDEETAAEQFGKGEKYFGIATMMATLPGTPMFGHGQVEGFTEKYGMEYTRAYRDETPDHGLVEHHKRVIFPILKDRHLFSSVEHFCLFDVTNDAGVQEDVYAFANRSKADGRTSLVFYNNAYQEASGWIQTSSPFNKGSTEEPSLTTRHLAEALGVSDDHDTWIGFKDLHSDKWIIRKGHTLHNQGLYVSLSAYQCTVFNHIQVLEGETDIWEQVAESHQNGWIDNVFEAYQKASQPTPTTTIVEDTPIVPDSSLSDEEDEIA